MAAKTVADKLLIKPRTTVWISDPEHRGLVEPLPEGAGHVAEYGLCPNGQVAVDEVWSALRFRPLKEGEPSFTGGR
ncbi:hypothetical protein ABZ297_16235 [Nonomuraea sp. NPDC005983]|uniref:hypothetical protein n=1 Tax=Nonomuraea sp. NPDC005983 TaxID=3155595 RepID=UPI0033AB35C2